MKTTKKPEKVKETKKQAPKAKVPPALKAQKKRQRIAVLPRHAGLAHDPRELQPSHVLKDMAVAAAKLGLKSVLGEEVYDFSSALLAALGRNEGDLAVRREGYKPLPKISFHAVDRDQFVSAVCRLIDVDEVAVRDSLPFCALVALTWKAYLTGDSNTGGPVMGWVAVYRVLAELKRLGQKYTTPPDIPCGAGGPAGEGIPPPRRQDDNTPEKSWSASLYDEKGRYLRTAHSRKEMNGFGKEAADQGYRFTGYSGDPADLGHHTLTRSRTAWGALMDRWPSDRPAIAGIGAGQQIGHSMATAPLGVSGFGHIGGGVHIASLPESEHGPTIRVTGRQIVCSVATQALGTTTPPAWILMNAGVGDADVFQQNVITPVGAGVTGSVIRVSPDNLNARMALIGQMYTRWRCSGMTFRYVPSCPTTTEGQLYIGHSADPSVDFENTNITAPAEIAQLNDSAMFPPWMAGELHIKSTSPWMFMEGAATQDPVMLRQVCCGAVIMCSSGSTTSVPPTTKPSVPLGTLWIEYSVEFAGAAPSYGIASAYQIRKMIGAAETQRVFAYLLANPVLLVKLVQETTPDVSLTPDLASLYAKLTELGLVTPPSNLCDRLALGQ